MAQGLTGKNVAFAGNGITQIFVNGVVQNSTSGTSLDFTIPSGVKDVRITWFGVSTTGTSEIIVQLGDSGGIQTTGYLSAGTNLNFNTLGTSTKTAGFAIGDGHSAGRVFQGLTHLALHDAGTHRWVGNYAGSVGATIGVMLGGGSVDLTNELTTVRITTEGGTDTFDAGSINVQYDNPDPTVIADTNRGTVVQTVHVQDGELATGTTTMPRDDTIPQNTEGNEFMTASITPTNAANKLKIEVVAHLSHSASVFYMLGALFQDSTAAAIASSIASTYNGTGGYAVVTFTHWMTAGTAASTTFKFRGGHPTAGTMTFNGQSSARQMGGTMASSITITEIAA